MKPVLVFFVSLTLSTPTLAAPVPAKHAAPALPAGDSLAGVKVGMDKDDARALLTARGATAGNSAAPDKDSGKDPDSKPGKHADPDDARPEVWMLKGTPYEKVVFASGDDDKILWVTGFARPGEGVPFTQLGTLSRAAASGPAFAVWNVISPRGSYRVIARGSAGKAATVSLLPLKSANPNGAFSPQIIPKSASVTPGVKAAP